MEHSIDYLVDSPVATERDHDVHALVGGAPTEFASVPPVIGLGHRELDLTAERANQHLACPWGRRRGGGIDHEERSHG
jgi:hypothetical protein